MRKLMLLAALPVLIAGCHKGHSKNPIAAAKEATTEPKLQKSWQSECSLKPLTGLATAALTWGQGGVNSMRTLLKFAGNNITRSTVYYASTDCATDVAQFDERGTFKIDEKQKSNDGGKNINVDFKNLTLVVHSEEGAKLANVVKLCRKADWSANSKEMDVTAASGDTTCYGVTVPRKAENIFRVDGDSLQLGAWDAQGRPATLTQKYTAK